MGAWDGPDLTVADLRDRDAGRRGELRGIVARLNRELVSSDATAVWSHAGQDRGATLASRVGEFLAGADFGGEAGVDGKVSESSVGKAALSGCRGPNDRENGRLPRSLRGSAPKILRAIAF